jgi:hypothetical protein
MGLFEDLRNLSELFKKRKDHVKGEEATKHALVLPFLQALGYDVYDPTEVRPEFIADFAKKKANGRFEKVDYLIQVKGEPAILVECKAIDAAVDAHDGQLRSYFNAVPAVKLAIVTNGLLYRFFTDLKLQHIMDDDPFFEFNMLQFNERAAGLIEPFTKTRFNSSAIKPHAEEVISLSKITNFVNELLRNPSEAFVKLIVSELDLVGDRRVNANVVARFEPIVKKAIKAALLDIVTKPIQQMQEPQQPALPPAPQETPVASPPIPPAMPTPPAQAQDPGIITTPEELEIFGLIKGICADSPSKATVQHKDAVNFFAINLGPVRSWFIRLYTGVRRKKSLLVRLPPAQVEAMAKGFQLESEPEGTRVFFNSTSDLEKLKPLIIRVYEDAVRHLKSGIE